MKHRVFSKRVLRTGVVSAVLAVSMLATSFSSVYAAGSADTADSETDSSSEADSENAEEYSSLRLTTNYTTVSSGYKYSDYSGDDVISYAGDNAEGDTAALVTDQTRDFDGSDKVLSLSRDDTADIAVEAPEDGLYDLKFSYLSYDESILPIQFMLSVDGDYPFYECRNVELDTKWKPQDEKSYDRYGNEVVTVPDKVIAWDEETLSV